MAIKFEIKAGLKDFKQQVIARRTLTKSRLKRMHCGKCKKDSYFIYEPHPDFKIYERLECCCKEFENRIKAKLSA